MEGPPWMALPTNWLPWNTHPAPEQPVLARMEMPAGGRGGGLGRAARSTAQETVNSSNLLPFQC